jgi:RNA polymerase sigma-32 factor
MSMTMNALQPVNSTLATATWGLVPSLGNLDAYISSANRMPMLTLDEEQRFAKNLRDNNDLDAAEKLVLSHLRLVVSVSRKYLGYGLPHGDLIQEGNIGLMKAVKRFDPDQGVRLVSYAMHWIKAEIHEYVLKNWRMVKMATTKAQRKLFFNLRSMKQEFKSDAAALGNETHSATMSESEVSLMAKTLNVKPEEVVEMEMRLSGGDVLLDPTPNDDGEEAFGPISYLSDTIHEPTNMIEAHQRDVLASDGISAALAELDDRSRKIVEERWLKVNDDSSGGMTLHDLAAVYGVSAERIRQIEVAAMKKMKKTLAEFA